MHRMNIDTAYSSSSIISHLSAHLSSFCTQWLIFFVAARSAGGDVKKVVDVEEDSDDEDPLNLRNMPRGSGVCVCGVCVCVCVCVLCVYLFGVGSAMA